MLHKWKFDDFVKLSTPSSIKKGFKIGSQPHEALPRYKYVEEGTYLSINSENLIAVLMGYKVEERQLENKKLY